MAETIVMEPSGGSSMTLVSSLRTDPILGECRVDREVYDGTWDWERIYRDCHGARNIAEELDRILGPDRGRVVFAGFPAAAADLARIRPLTFVDRSDNVVRAAEAAFESLTDLAPDDVLNLLLRHDARHVVISGRLSAFWDKQESFDRLQNAILAFHRTRVVVDFFDAGAAHVGQVLLFGRPPSSGIWRVQYVRREPTTFGPTIYRVGQDVSYSLDQELSEYNVERSYFLAAQILSWATICFPEHYADVGRPLISGDPSFTLVLRSRTTPSPSLACADDEIRQY
jgi:hypothetical protein